MFMLVHSALTVSKMLRLTNIIEGCRSIVHCLFMLAHVVILMHVSLSYMLLGPTLY